MPAASLYIPKTKELVKRIEKTQASQKAAREADTKRTLDDYGKK